MEQRELHSRPFVSVTPFSVTLKTLMQMCPAVMGENILRAIREYYDNSYENIGAWNSFTWSIVQ